MTFDKRITMGNVLTIISFVVIGLVFVMTTRTASLEASQATRLLAPKVEANTEAVKRLEVISENRSDDMKYLTQVVRSIAIAVDAEIPIKDPSE